MTPPVRLSTERTAEEAFTEDRYLRTFNNWVTGIYETTVGGKYVTANPALARMFGYESPAEMMAVITDADSGCYVDPGRRGEFVRRIREHSECAILPVHFRFKARHPRRRLRVRAPNSSAPRRRGFSGWTHFGASWWPTSRTICAHR